MPDDVKPHETVFRRIIALALSYPETVENFPWGESAVKVNGKTFLFTRHDPTGLHLSVKLPRSRDFALNYEFARPTGYGLGRSGWVSASFSPEKTPPLDILEAWIAESYEAVAPKRLRSRH